ncbi:MAG: serine/threonine kinase [Tardiphaga sp.]|nr:serine/threonine kinase [Tardiphaga sp.]
MSQQAPYQPPRRGVAPGTRLNGIYEIDAMIGAGGMGEIYKSHEIQTGAAVAIKMLLPDVADNEISLALFRREAAALHHLPHDAIVRYFLFTVEPILQRPYLAMEFVDGRSLSDLLQDGALPFEQLVKLLRRIASGFQAAHERGIIHRDVSPDNIIVPHGDVTKAKIIDFGIARSTQVGDPTIIGSGFAGKQNYVSPEQVGLYGGDITPKSDIYSLGLVLYYAASGHKLDMGGSQFDLVEKRRRIPALDAVDERLRPMLSRMLEPDPANRLASMEEISSWSFATSEHAVAPERVAAEVRPLSPPANGAQKFPSWIILAGAFTLIAAGGAFFALHGTNDAGAPPPAPPRLDPGATSEPRPLPPATPDPSSTAQPPSLPAIPPGNDAASRTDQIRTYVEHYEGDCLFLMPVAISANAAVLEGFAASPVRLEAFAANFRRELGFAPSVGARVVTDAQCAAVRFMNQLRGERVRTPRISLASTTVQNGETLNGTIENVANRAVDLLLISDTGQVQNLSNLLKPGIDVLSFSIGMQRSDGPARPQLLIVLASPQPIDALKLPRFAAADQLFPKLLLDMQASGTAITAAARYFRLGK